MRTSRGRLSKSSGVIWDEMLLLEPEPEQELSDGKDEEPLNVDPEPDDGMLLLGDDALEVVAAMGAETLTV